MTQEFHSWELSQGNELRIGTKIKRSLYKDDSIHTVYNSRNLETTEMSNNRRNALANYNTSMAWNIMQQLKLPKGKTIGKHRKAFENNAGRGLKNTEYLPSTRHCPTHLYLSSSSPESKINLFFNKNKNKPILTPFSLTRKQVQNLPPVPELAKNRAQM